MTYIPIHSLTQSLISYYEGLDALGYAVSHGHWDIREVVQRAVRERKSQAVAQRKDDLEDIKNLLVKIGFPKSKIEKYAETLVIGLDIGSEALFQLKIGSNRDYYTRELQWNTDETMLISRYLDTQVSIENLQKQIVQLQEQLATATMRSNANELS